MKMQESDLRPISTFQNIIEYDKNTYDLLVLELTATSNALLPNLQSLPYFIDKIAYLRQKFEKNHDLIERFGRDQLSDYNKNHREAMILIEKGIIAYLAKNTYLKLHSENFKNITEDFLKLSYSKIILDNNLRLIFGMLELELNKGSSTSQALNKVMTLPEALSEESGIKIVHSIYKNEEFINFIMMNIDQALTCLSLLDTLRSSGLRDEIGMEFYIASVNHLLKEQIDCHDKVFSHFVKKGNLNDVIAKIHSESLLTPGLDPVCMTDSITAKNLFSI